MQEYYPLNVQENVSVVIPKIQKSLESVSSCFSGSSFPTTNLQVGMLCMRTDDNNTLYKLVSTNPITWQSVGQEAVTAEKWANPISIKLTGKATSSAVDIDGSSNIDINVTDVTATALDSTFFNSLFKQFANKAFPVGFIWESTDATNPANILGVGTWESYGQGRVLIGAGQGSGLSNYTAGSTGGEEKHKLTTDELAQHNHNGSASSSGSHYHYIFANKAGSPINPNVGINISASQTPCATSFRDNWGGENYSIVGTTTSATLGKTASNGSHTHTVTTNNNGNNVAHNNMQPYIVVYRYRRKV